MTIPIFTFHYVYIYIQCTEIRSCVTLLFTFHYVYIYICLCAEPEAPSFEIYIPLCLYLYYTDKLVITNFSHLHSTMFIFIFSAKRCNKPCNRIYIPLCLYLYEHHRSRPDIFQVHLHSTMFIFICIPLEKCPGIVYHLHSTMFIFISLATLERFSFNCNLHSTMFIFICCLCMEYV